MKTDDLIQQLAAQAAPVKRLPPAEIRFGRWLAASLVYAAACLGWIGLRADLGTIAAAPGFWWQTALLVALAVSSAWLAFRFSVPGREGGAVAKILVCLVGAAWVGSIAGLVMLTPGHAVDEGLGCSLEIALIGGLPALLLIAMLRRAAPLPWMWTGALAGLAMIGLGAGVLQFACSSGDPMHLLVWHVLPGSLFVLAGIAIASRLFKQI
jgi:hypothetical protein